MAQDSQQTPQPPGLLDTVVGRLALVGMVALLIAGVIAVVVLSGVFSNDTNANAAERPSERLLRSDDFGVTGLRVLTIDPPAMTGSCPVPVTFTAEIDTTGAAGTLLYRWFWQDAGESEAQELEVDEGQTRTTVTTARPFGSAGPRYKGFVEAVSIQVLEPVPTASRRLTFRMNCQ